MKYCNVHANVAIKVTKGVLGCFLTISFLSNELSVSGDLPWTFVMR